jgi:hypothetical protein
MDLELSPRSMGASADGPGRWFARRTEELTVVQFMVRCPRSPHQTCPAPKLTWVSLRRRPNYRRPAPARSQTNGVDIAGLLPICYYSVSGPSFDMSMSQYRTPRFDLMTLTFEQNTLDLPDFVSALDELSQDFIRVAIVRQVPGPMASGLFSEAAVGFALGATAAPFLSELSKDVYRTLKVALFRLYATIKMQANNRRYVPLRIPKTFQSMEKLVVPSDWTGATCTSRCMASTRRGNPVLFMLFRPLRTIRLACQDMCPSSVAASGYKADFNYADWTHNWPLRKKRMPTSDSRLTSGLESWAATNAGSWESPAEKGKT